MNVMGIKEFQSSASKVSHEVENGETFLILRHNKPVMKVSPVAEDDHDLLLDFTQIQKGGVKLSEVLSRL